VSRPRIRSLKPEGLQHPKVGKLSDRAFRLWVGLITQADDEGRLRWRPDQFSRIIVFGYHEKVTATLVSETLLEIVVADLAYHYVVDDKEYVELHDWKEHQKVDRPVASILPARVHESSRVLASPRVDLDLDLGSGSEESLAEAPTAAPPPTPQIQVEARSKKPPRKIAAKADEEKSKGALAFESYAKAYQARYGVPPIRNKQVNSIFKALADHLGHEAPEVAAFFVGRQDPFYVRDKHSPSLLRRDYQKIRTEWATRNVAPAAGPAAPSKPVSHINPALTTWGDERRAS